jgi:hypothetical protein
VLISRFKGEKIVRELELADMLGFLQQLGAIPSGPQ